MNLCWIIPLAGGSEKRDVQAADLKELLASGYHEWRLVCHRASGPREITLYAQGDGKTPPSAIEAAKGARHFFGECETNEVFRPHT
jgi:hypothetical protein